MTALGLTKEQFRYIAFDAKPELTDAEFDALWADYILTHPRRRC